MGGGGGGERERERERSPVLVMQAGESDRAEETRAEGGWLETMKCKSKQSRTTTKWQRTDKETKDELLYLVS